MITPPGLRTKLTLVSPTQYDWRNVALSIIGNAKTPYDKAKAIYCWLCANISYDTSYKIHNADAAWKKNKGVCQAYCELFYRLGLAVGLDVRIVSGKSKQSDGSVGNVDHAWIAVNISGTIEKKNLFPESITYYDSQAKEANFPSTRGLTRQTAILIDPTWGAGKIVNKRFCRSINDMSWFNVEPEWMIFTHYPDNQQDQMLGSASLNKTQFMSLPYAVPKYKGFGFDAKMSLNTLLNKNIKLPEINTDASDYVEFVDIPLSDVLKKNTNYQFVFKKKKECCLALFGKDNYRDDDKSLWQTANNISKITINTGDSENLNIGINWNGTSSFLMFLTYKQI